MKCAKMLDGECIRLLITEKSLKRQMQLRSQDSQEIEDLTDLLNGAVAEEHRSPNTIESLRERFISV